MPLGLAMKQIVPPGYNWSYGPGVDAATKISWNGGQPWHDVLENALAARGLSADIQGSSVHVTGAAPSLPKPQMQGEEPSYGRRQRPSSPAHAPAASLQASSIPTPSTSQDSSTLPALPPDVSPSGALPPPDYAERPAAPGRVAVGSISAQDDDAQAMPVSIQSSMTQSSAIQSPAVLSPVAISPAAEPPAPVQHAAVNTVSPAAQATTAVSSEPSYGRRMPRRRDDVGPVASNTPANSPTFVTPQAATAQAPVKSAADKNAASWQPASGPDPMAADDSPAARPSGIQHASGGVVSESAEMASAEAPPRTAAFFGLPLSHEYDANNAAAQTAIMPEPSAPKAAAPAPVAPSTTAMAKPFATPAPAPTPVALDRAPAPPAMPAKPVEMSALAARTAAAAQPAPGPVVPPALIAPNKPAGQNDPLVKAAYATLDKNGGDAAAQAPDAPADPNGFNAQAGENLKSVMTRWCKQAKIELAWTASHDYALSQPVSVSGNFGTALKQAMEQFNGMKSRPQGTLQTNANTGGLMFQLADAPG